MVALLHRPTKSSCCFPRSSLQTSGQWEGVQIRRPVTAEPLTASSAQGHAQGHPQAVVGRPEGRSGQGCVALVAVAHAREHRPGQEGDGQYLLLKAGPGEHPDNPLVPFRAESGSSWAVATRNRKWPAGA